MCVIYDFVLHLVVNGWATAQQNHLGKDQCNKQVLMDGRPVRSRYAGEKQVKKHFNFIRLPQKTVIWKQQLEKEYRPM